MTRFDEVARCFRRGDAAILGTMLRQHRDFEREFPGENPGWSDLLARLQIAAEIMEGQE